MDSLVQLLSDKNPRMRLAAVEVRLLVQQLDETWHAPAVTCCIHLLLQAFFELNQIDGKHADALRAMEQDEVLLCSG